MSEYLKLSEVARRLDVSDKTARRYVKSGALQSSLIGGMYRVTPDDLETFIENRRVRPVDAQTAPKAEAPPSGQPELKDGIPSEEAFGEAYILGGLRETVREIDELRALRELQAQIDDVINARVHELRREAG